jgi:uncharacterized membrane protein YbaN (DUF454 family)
MNPQNRDITIGFIALGATIGAVLSNLPLAPGFALLAGFFLAKGNYEIPNRKPEGEK